MIPRTMIPFLTTLAICFAGYTAADPLPDMVGEWFGTGWARQAGNGPQEGVRCRIENSHDVDRHRLRITGICAVPGRKFDMDGALTADADGRVTGFWRNPDGPGDTTVSGQIDGDAVHFTFQARDPKTGIDLSQISTWQLINGVLSFRSVTRSDQSPMIAIDFTR